MAINFHAGRRIQGLADDRSLTTQAVYTSVTGQSTYEKLNGTAISYSSEKYGVKLVSTANDGKKIKIGKWKLAREGTLSGLAYMKVEDSSGTVKATSTGVSVSSLILRTSGYAYVTFTLTEAVTLYNGDRVYVEYTTADSSGSFLAVGSFYNGSTTIPTGFESTVYNKTDSGGNNPSGTWTNDGLPTLLIPDAIFDDQPVTNENQITNVQVGSRYEETDTRKMYDYADPLTFEDDFSSDNWTDKGSMGVSGGTLTGANVLDGGDDTSYYDLTSTSDTNWILRFKGTYTTTYGTGNASKLLYVGLSSDINAQNTAKDFAGFIFEQWNLPQFKISGGVVNNATLEYASSLSNLNALNTSSATTVTNYFEIKRDNDNFTFTVYSNSDYTGQLATVTRTVSSVTTLRYLVLTNRDSSASNTGSLTVSVDDLNFYNGVTTTSNYWQEIGA